MKIIRESQEETKVLYVIRDKHGNQLSMPKADDGELWDRVESMEARGKRGLSVVVYKNKPIMDSIQEDDLDYKAVPGDEILEGMMGNASDDLIDYTVRVLEFARRNLKVQRISSVQGIFTDTYAVEMINGYSTKMKTKVIKQGSIHGELTVWEVKDIRIPYIVENLYHENSEESQYCYFASESDFVDAYSLVTEKDLQV